jgi:hypothetical protein
LGGKLGSKIDYKIEGEGVAAIVDGCHFDKARSQDNVVR